MLDLVEAVETSGPTYRARNSLVAKILLHCGQRVSELVSLNIDQVHMDGERDQFCNVVRKGGRKLQSIPFNNVVAEALKLYRPVRERLDPNGEDPALLLSDRGKRMSVRAVQSMLRRYAKKAGFERDIWPHLLRHSHSNELAEGGESMRTIQDRLGHASIKTTQLYVNPSEAVQRRATQRQEQRWKKRQEDRQAETQANSA